MNKESLGDKSLEEQFIEDGYVVIRNALDRDLIKKIQALVIRGLCEQIEGGENKRVGGHIQTCVYAPWQGRRGAA